MANRKIGKWENRKVSKSEIIIIPNEKKGFTAIVEGMELRKDGSLKDAIGSPISKLSSDQLKINKEIYKEIESNIKDLREYWDKETPSNEMLLNKLAKTDNMWMGILNLRQPRNGYDVIINKIHRESLGQTITKGLIPDKLRTKGEPYLKGGKKI